MRTTEAQAAVERALTGDEPLAEAMAQALDAWEPVERATHHFHTYPAGLHPDAARDLLALFPAGAVLDPFCGGGTTLVEARLAGRQAVGRDLSTVAIRVARARTASPSDEQLTAMRSRARKLTELARQATELPPEHIKRAAERWYARAAAVELWSLVQGVQQSDPLIRPWLEAVLSSILVKVSWRESDTSARRKTHRRPPGTTAVLFHKKTRELARKMTALRDALPEGTPEADIALGDARHLHLSHPVGLVLTSPPYPSVYDYLPLQHLRRVWLGADPGEAPMDEIGSRRQFKEQGHREARRAWVSDTRAWIEASARALEPGGHLVVVVGDGLTPSGAVDTVQPTLEGAREAGMEFRARASLRRVDHARQATRWEHVMAFSKGE